MKSSFGSIFLLAMLSGCGGLVAPEPRPQPEEPTGLPGTSGGESPPVPPPPAPSPGTSPGTSGQDLRGTPATEGFDVGAFTAEYYSGTTLVATETVERPTIHYPWSDFHGIKSEDFRGVWKGTLDVTAPSVAIDFNADYSWADGKLFIDEKEIAWAPRMTQTLGAGSHSVRVELDNNWHTTGFNMSFTSNRIYASSEARAKIAPTLTADTKLVEVAIYESADRYNDVGVTLRGAKAPVFLVLSSYAAVKWVIDNPDGVEIRGVAYGSYGPGSTVVVAAGTPTYEVENLRYEEGGASSVAGRAADLKQGEYALEALTIAVP